MSDIIKFNISVQQKKETASSIKQYENSNINTNYIFIEIPYVEKLFTVDISIKQTLEQTKELGWQQKKFI